MSSLVKKLRSWRGGFKGFERFLRDARPIVNSGGKRAVFELWPWQRDIIRESFAPQIRTVVLSWPRRHGKSTVNALRTLWHACTKPDATIVVAALNLDQGIATGFKLIKDCILATPALRDLVGAENVLTDSIRFPWGTTIETLTASPGSALGRGIDVLFCTELAAAPPDGGVFQPLASGLGDRQGIALIDSTASCGEGHVFHAMWKTSEAGEDPTLFFSLITWAPGQPILTPLLSESFLESRRRSMLPAEFRRYHQNLWTTGGSPLFQAEEVEAARCEPVTLEQLGQRHEHLRFGIGADLALAGSKNADESWLALVVVASNERVPVTQPDQEFWWPGQVRDEEYELREGETVYVLRAIKAPTLEEQRRAYDELCRMAGHHPGAAVEAYMSAGLVEHMKNRGGWPELIHPGPKVQAEVFGDFHRAVNSGTFRIPRSGEFDEVLCTQMQAFECDLSATVPRFGAAKKGRGGRDDLVYAVAYALRAAGRCGITRTIQL